jgi:hypothetical protein
MNRYDRRLIIFFAYKNDNISFNLTLFFSTISNLLVLVQSISAAVKKEGKLMSSKSLLLKI